MHDYLLVEDGKPKPATAEALSNLFKYFPAIKCVLLNACYAEVQAKAIVQHVDYVIGMKQAVQDDAAIKFAAAFYEVLGYGRSIDDAFGLGCNAIQMNDGNFSGISRKFIYVGSEGSEEKPKRLESYQIPVLLKKDKGLVDISTIQAGITAERVKDKSINKEEGLKQFREKVRTTLDTGVLTSTKWIQLGTSATVLGITEADANRILEEEQKRLAIQTQPFSFKVATVTVERGFIPGTSSIKTSYKDGRAEAFAEKLDQSTILEMVSIRGGNLAMGSPSTEKERQANEGPQHLVRIPAFFIGKYTVTQSQWFVVATDLPKVNMNLEPDPSHFKGPHRPVEQVYWNQAVEFCDRLSQKTGKKYRLPSEAEWEYACRAETCQAGTSPPFHFGETITTDLANYNGNYTYGSGTKGIYRQETEKVGSFPPNALGLYDMHGNVWEWCADHWHETYQGAPTDGSAWVTGGDSDLRLRCGGSWLNDPRSCRSASRYRSDPGYGYDSLGFRVVCSAA